MNRFRNFIKKYYKSFFRFLLIAILIIIQIALMFALYYVLKHNVVIVYVAIEILSFIVILELMGEDRNSAHKIYWMCILFALPIVGHIMFDLWGKESAHKKEHARINGILTSINSHQVDNREYIYELYKENRSKGKISSYLHKRGYPMYKNTEMKYFHVGEAAFEDIKIELMKAEKFIFMSFFTIEDGKAWDDIKEQLYEKAKNGVEIKIIFDDAGSAFKISDHTIEELKKNGIEVLRFNSIENKAHKLFMNYRDHQRIIIIDGNISYIGGVTIADSWVNINENKMRYKGVALKCIGDAVYSITLIFLGMWATSYGEMDVEKYKPTVRIKNNNYCQPFADGPSNYPADVARDLYIHMINEADSFIYFMTSYLILDDTVRDMLVLAARSGVDVRIIVPGVTDRKIMKLVTESNYGHLLENGVKIYECNSGFMHAKMCVNDYSAFVGTVNMDFRSFFINYECGVWTCDIKMVAELMRDYVDTLSECEELSFENWKNRPRSKKIKQSILQLIKTHL